MLRSVLKEGFRGGREATVEQLTEQFCQKVSIEYKGNLNIKFNCILDQKCSFNPTVSNTGHESLQGQGGTNTAAEEGEGGGKSEG